MNISRYGKRIITTEVPQLYLARRHLTAAEVHKLCQYIPSEYEGIQSTTPSPKKNRISNQPPQISQTEEESEVELPDDVESDSD